MFSNIFGQNNSDGEQNNEQQSFAEQVEERLHRMEKRITTLEKRVKELESKSEVNVADKTTSQQTLNSSTVDTEVKVVETYVAPQPTTNVLFMAAPNTDGVFTDVSTTEHIGKSIYQLTTRDGISGSYIMLDTHDAIATAIISVSQFVKPACKVIGNQSAFPRNIITTEEGLATKDGETWRITRKAVVKFE